MSTKNEVVVQGKGCKSTVESNNGLRNETILYGK